MPSKSWKRLLSESSKTYFFKVVYVVVSGSIRDLITEDSLYIFLAELINRKEGINPLSVIN